MHGKKNFPNFRWGASEKSPLAKGSPSVISTAPVRSPFMGTIISHSPAETLALGENWGRTSESGLVIGLSGELGAGKTQLVKGLVLGLGSTQFVHSPTFAKSQRLSR